MQLIWLHASCCLTRPGSLTHSFLLPARGLRKEKKWKNKKWWSEKVYSGRMAWGGYGIWKEWREWENQRWSRGLRGGDDLLGCVCSQSPPLWHNRTMYSKGFKYLYPDLMFLATHTHIYTRAWKGWMLNCLPWITEVSSPPFYFLPLWFFSCTPLVVSVQVSRSVSSVQCSRAPNKDGWGQQDCVAVQHPPWQSL